MSLLIKKSTCSRYMSIPLLNVIKLFTITWYSWYFTTLCQLCHLIVTCVMGKCKNKTLDMLWCTPPPKETFVGFARQMKYTNSPQDFVFVKWQAVVPSRKDFRMCGYWRRVGWHYFLTMPIVFHFLRYNEIICLKVHPNASCLRNARLA